MPGGGSPSRTAPRAQQRVTRSATPSRPRSSAPPTRRRRGRAATLGRKCDRVAHADGGRYAALIAIAARSASASRTSAMPQSYGTFSHLWPSVAHESARAVRPLGERIAGRPRPRVRRRRPRVPRRQPVRPVAHRTERIERTGVDVAGLCADERRTGRAAAASRRACGLVDPWHAHTRSRPRPSNAQLRDRRMRRPR